MDEAPIRQRPLELASQLAHVHVHGTVSRAQRIAPDAAVELLARDHRPDALRHRREQFELPHRQHERLSGGEYEAFLDPDLELPRVQDLRKLRARAVRIGRGKRSRGCHSRSRDVRALRIDGHDPETSQARASAALQTRYLIVKNP